MKTRISALTLLTLTAAIAAPAAADTLTERTNRGLVEVITGSTAGSSARIAEDLADVLDDGATRRVLPVVGKGSLQDLVDLKALRGVDLAIVQADVLDHVKMQRALGVDSGVTYIAKLYNEEFHLLARGDVHGIADLAGKKVNFGSQGDGTTITGPRLFELLKVPVEATSYGQAMALEKLKRGQIAAMAFVTAKPAPLFSNLRAQDGLHFLAVPLKSDMAARYSPARLTADDYPGLAAQGPVDTVAVGTVLVVANLVPESERYRNAASFVEAFFTQFPKLLEAPHHPKWSEVNLAAELPGWRRFAPADAWIKRNGAAGAVAMSEDQMRDIFVKFLDERSKVSGSAALSGDQKDQLFAQFRRWQDSH
ncbi:MAG TPA: TAXI family TRAP transporter solute-binding subunit [Stellaceae bacterium]|nr:TAXI family TRAP transporter solute-binding subunit [Stellaceae bacterium]